MIKYDFTKQRITPSQVAQNLRDGEGVNVVLPTSKLDRFLTSVPKAFRGRLKLKLIPKNADAREIITGSLMGGILGLGIGLTINIVKKVNPYITIATTIIGIAIGYFLTKYDVDFRIAYDNRGNELAKLKFRPA